MSTEKDSAYRLLDYIRVHIKDDEYINAIVLSRDLCRYIESIFKGIYKNKED